MNQQTLLLRQINPSYKKADGSISWQAFKPKPKDENLLSVYDGDLITPQAAFAHFATMPNCRTVGVMGVLVAECTTEKLPARPDPDAFREHAVIDFSGLSEDEVKDKSSILRDYAFQRGWCHGPTQ